MVEEEEEERLGNGGWEEAELIFNGDLGASGKFGCWSCVGVDRGAGFFESATSYGRSPK